MTSRRSPRSAAARTRWRSTRVGGEQATGWVLGNGNFDVIIVTVRSDAVVWNFTYLAAGDLPDVLEVSAAGVAKFDG